MKLIKKIKTVKNIVYVYDIDGKLFAFKPSNNIDKEIIANKLARLFDIRTLEIKAFKIKNKKGILMDYIKDKKLLTDYKKELKEHHLQQLKKIILFDIWIGNKDRHTANIFINDDLIAFDHDNIFNEGNTRNLIKFDIGRKLNKNFVDIIEKLQGKKISVKKALNKIGFKEEDFIKINEEKIREIVKNKNLQNYLIIRKEIGNLKF